jgi:hypothetical protein
MAKALVFELMRQHNGSNNGHLRLSRNWLAARGWKCVASIASARDELLHYRLITQTRHGGLRNGSHLYAMTWLAVTNFVGLDIGPHQYHPGAYLLPTKEPFQPRPKQNGCLPRSPRNAAVGLPHSPSKSGLGLPRSPETAVFEQSLGLPGRHKLLEPFPAVQFPAPTLPGMRTAARMRAVNWRLT